MLCFQIWTFKYVHSISHLAGQVPDHLAGHYFEPCDSTTWGTTPCLVVVQIFCNCWKLNWTTGTYARRGVGQTCTPHHVRQRVVLCPYFALCKKYHKSNHIHISVLLVKGFGISNFIFSIFRFIIWSETWVKQKQRFAGWMRFLRRLE